MVLSCFIVLPPQLYGPVYASLSASSLSPPISATARNPARFIPFCSYHHFETRIPGHSFDSSHGSIIGYVKCIAQPYYSSELCTFPILPTRSLSSPIPLEGTTIRHLETSGNTSLSAGGPTCDGKSLASCQYMGSWPTSLIQIVGLPAGLPFKGS